MFYLALANNLDTPYYVKMHLIRRLSTSHICTLLGPTRSSTPEDLRHVFAHPQLSGHTGKSHIFALNAPGYTTTSTWQMLQLGAVG